IVAAIADLACLALVHHISMHRLLEPFAEVEEGHRVDPGAVGVQRELGPVADLAMFVVVDLGHHFGAWPRRLPIGCGGAFTRRLDQAVEIEGPRGTEFEMRRGGSVHRTRAESRDTDSGQDQALQKPASAAINYAQE